MDDTLKATLYCDTDHPDIQAMAVRLKADDTDPAAIAGRTFHFVRDRIAFGFDLYHRKASETIARGYGACWNKALLVTALLRSNGIAARFGSIPLRRTFIQPVIGRWHWIANHPFHHCIVHAWLNDRWTIIDPTLDKGSYDTFFRPLYVPWKIDWNGHDNVRLYTESVLGPPVMHADIDGVLNIKVMNNELPKPFVVWICQYLNRQMWKKVEEAIRTGNKATQDACTEYISIVG